MSRWQQATESEQPVAEPSDWAPLQPLTQHERDCAKVYSLQLETARRAQNKHARRPLFEFDGGAA